MDSASAGSSDPKSSFQDALARAKQIAAKINQPTPGGGDASAPTLKRPLSNEGDNFGEPEQKKTLAAINDPIGSQLKFSQPPNSSAAQAAQAAQEAAARINRQLGIGPASQPPTVAAPPPAPMMQKPSNMPGPHAGMGMVVTEDYQVPDHMVGLIIGKAGEQITRLQAETGCKVQIAPDSGGAPERPCTLTGMPASIQQCKQQIQEIIRKGQAAGTDHMGGGGGGGMMGGENTVIELMIPGDKVGLIIGKAGENIKQLQEQCGVKMVMIQDSNIPSAAEKPLRISGDPAKCQKARDQVMAQLKDKEFDGKYKMNSYGGQQSIEIPVPRNLVGIVIGKNGEVIKNIQKDTMAKVQFKPEDPNGMFQDENRYCSIKGSQEQVEAAARRIEQLLQDAGHRNDQFGGRMGGPGMNRGYGGEEHTTFSVPADKCGLVIGKGGDTIRQINSMSGAKVELQRTPGPNPNEKVFNIRGGDRNQIQHAIQLICERAGLPCPPPGGMGGPGPGGPHGGPGGYGDGGYGGPQQGGQPPNNQYGGPQGPQGGWGNYNQPQGYQGQPDPKAADNAAAWAAYYQYYAQYGQQQGQPQQQQQQTNQPPQQQQGGQPQQGFNAHTPQHSINPQTGQPDYSAAWAEYYRSQGMHIQANMILQQAAAANNQGGGQIAPTSVQQPQ